MPLIFALWLLWPAGLLSADNLLLHNGHNVEGVIVSETQDAVSIEVGGGVVEFAKDEVREIRRATPDEAEELYARWGRRQKKLKNEELAAQVERDKALEAWRQSSARQEALKVRQQEEQLRLDAATKAVPAKSENGHIWVDAQVNADVPATLVVDTGSPTVLLTFSFISRLQLQPKDLQVISKITVLNGEQKAAYVVLKSFKVGDVEEKNVPAMILLEPNAAIEKGCRDGLLGLTFLERFHVTFDPANGRILLRSISAK
ncbi:MAG: TIGR02281 family clan AA aspartic protease [Candidatus Omnitrophica bacterium]|nr:TIGR02281 family clan AA aspartic protease [Candidatus Omnitrophota bacterium]